MNALFQPFQLATTPLANRIAMAPMTRSRVPDDVADTGTALYYAQRATAGLIIAEGAPISREGQGYLFNPGIYTPEQIAGWRLTTQTVHALGGKIFAQIWHVGRVSHRSIQPDGAQPVSATSIPAKDATVFAYDASGAPGTVAVSTPRALLTDEVSRVVQDFANAAANAIDAGFDGIEIHGANGYLFEQFLNPLVNNRGDKYSAGSMENRLRFTLEVVDAVVAAIGRDRVGIRLSPFGTLFDMPKYDDVEITYAALAQELGDRKIAYVHLMDQSGFRMLQQEIDNSGAVAFKRLLGVFRQSMPHTALILAGGMTRDHAERLIAEGTIDLAAFGQPFISNPDLVARLRNNWPLTEPDRATYYAGGAHGLIDYPPYAAAA